MANKNYKRHEKLFHEEYTYRFNRRNKNSVYHICVISTRYMDAPMMSLDIEENSAAPLTCFWRKCCALAFVSPNMIDFSYKELSREAREKFPQMSNFMKYLKDTYIGDQYNLPMFPPTFWSVHNRVIENQPRTNNALESWNRRLNATSRVIHPYFNNNNLANNMAQVKKSRLQLESDDDEQTQPTNQPKIKRQRPF